LSIEQKAIGFRVILFIAALTIMILLAGFAFSTDDIQSEALKETVSISKTN